LGEADQVAGEESAACDNAKCFHMSPYVCSCWNVPGGRIKRLATAQTKQWGGFGSAWVETSVSIRKIDGTVNRGKPFDVFSYPGGCKIPKTYVLSDENLDPDLQMVWLGSNHLQLIHRSPIDPDLEVIRFSNVDISFQ
jgi:hypothetical protein